MNKRALSERDICTKFITPSLIAAGWDIDAQVREEVGFTDSGQSAGSRIEYMKPNHPPPITLGNMRAVSLCGFLFALAFACVPADAQSNRITCAGILIDVDMRTNAEWPLAVIYDADGHYTCTIDRTGSGHDPLKPCSAGEKCRVVGTFRKVGHTYSIRIIDSVDRAD